MWEKITELMDFYYIMLWNNFYSIVWEWKKDALYPKSVLCFHLPLMTFQEQLATIKYFQKHIYNTCVNNSVYFYWAAWNKQEKLTTIKQSKLFCFYSKKEFSESNQNKVSQIKIFFLDHYRIKEVLLLTTLFSFKYSHRGI